MMNVEQATPNAEVHFFIRYCLFDIRHSVLIR